MFNCFNFFKKKIYSNYAMDHHHETDAGWDIFISEDAMIHPRGRYSFHTGLHVAIPKGCVGLVLPRSSVSRDGLHVCTGVIDAGYSGEILVTVYNHTPKNKPLNKFTRVAQLVILPCILPQNVITDTQEIKEINAKMSDRGEGGYGSTGK